MTMKRANKIVKKGIIELLAIVLMVSLTACNQSAPFESGVEPKEGQMVVNQSTRTSQQMAGRTTTQPDSLEQGDFVRESRYANAWSK